VTNPENPILVVGGGIGGLAAALALAKRGFAASVLEQAPTFGEIGAGIQLGPNAFYVLDRLGLGEHLKRDAVFIDRLVMMDSLSGEEVAAIPVDEPFRKRFGNPYAVIHRADLHGVLLEGCRAAPNVTLLTSQQVAGFVVQDFVVETDGAPLEFGHASPNAQRVVIARRTSVAAMRLRDNDETVIL